MREAASWFARMRGPDAAGAEAEFQAWLRRGALHRAAYNRAAEVFAMGKLLDGEASPPGRPVRRKPVLAASLAAALALAGAAWLTMSAVPNPKAGAPAPIAAASTDATFATGSEARAIRLADGSRVRLGEATRLEVVLTATDRRLRLVRGRARFEVAHEARPFTVAAGGGLVTARGTIFDVAYQSGGEVSVELIEGAIDVALPPARGAMTNPVRRLAPGDALRFAAATPLSGQAEPPLATSARDDAPIEFAAIRLDALIARANRRNARAIRLADPALAARPVSGRLRIGEPVRLAIQLAALLDLEADTVGTGDIVLRPRQPGS